MTPESTPHAILDDDLAALQRALAGKYLVERELGRGGMATVYLARDLAHERLVALKLLRAELTGAAAAERFLREIKILARLQHPNILTMLDSGILDLEGGLRLPFFTMPYVEGESLRERMKGDHKPTTAESVRIVREIADALAAAHAAGVVHRDLKPENVLISQGHAMVSDFGIAKAMSSSVETPTVTGTGLVLGTPAYMAPEQALGDPEMDHRADLYSLGVIAYELFGGAQPFGTRTPQQMLVAHATVTPQPIRKRAPDLDPPIGELVMRLLQKRPADRPANAAEVVATLDAIANGTAARRGSSRRIRVGVAAVVALALIGAFGAWIMQRPSASVGTAGAAGASVAVLPFDNVGGDQQKQYLSDGLSEQVMYALSKVSGLRVSPRASAFAFRGRGAAFHEIEGQLHVAHVLEGSVQQSGTQLRVLVQLINVATGNADWSDEYRREASGVFAVQDEIARAIVRALGARLTVGATALLAGAGTKSLEAYDLYMKGRYAYEQKNQEDLIKAEMLFKQAIAKDSLYARAYAGLSDTYAFLGIFGYITHAAAAQPAKAAAETALRLDSASVEAYTSLGFVRLFYDWDWLRSRQALEHAIALDSLNAAARFWHAWYYVAANQLDSAVIEGQRSADLDPAAGTGNVGWLIQLAGRHDEALAFYRKLLPLDSTNAFRQIRIAASSAALNKCDDALRAIKWTKPLEHTFFGVPIGYVLGKCNRQAEARALAAALESRAPQLPSAAEELAAVYAALGEKDKAFRWLERAYDERSGPLYKMRADPSFASLRSDPRFTAIVNKMHLP